jgi:glutaredoxin
LFLLTLLVLPGPAAADSPVVRAVLFWSDGCPHCHYVIDEVLPPIQEGYGEQFQLKLLQVEHPANQMLYQKTVETYAIPPERYGVPCLIIGNRVLVGSQEIPDQFETEIKRWLAADPAFADRRAQLEAMMPSE